jgi:hypothetical protein
VFTHDEERSLAMVRWIQASEMKVKGICLFGMNLFAPKPR